MKYITTEQREAFEEMAKRVEQKEEEYQEALGFEFEDNLKKDFEYLLYGVQGGEKEVVEAVMRLTTNSDLMDYADSLLDELEALGL
ncbi:hypothetical protein 278BB001_23 [Bacillus phage 278BB001]|nr:hypothetical protein 010DV004_32 [Bacillus phage 010DV004]QZA69249.1 hypothetical protein 010DV005_32 [Bacillus phage 010DV005]QZA69818.1 hypothetical protein 043JT007_32 [Bacillus phage 043JT007]QZA70174.1 hypothetical protein 278BB001_23 [Bacillus phage 278BB001]